MYIIVLERADRMSNVKGMVFAIEEFSTFDGPGIRTTVFLKGCPLRCSWCHNPEGQSFEQEVLKSPNGCLKCGRCIETARKLTGKAVLVPECVPVCPRNLIRISGTEYSADELCQKLLKNVRFYQNGGGVTFSGGEPLSQARFVKECFINLKGKVSRALQTSGYCDKNVFADILTETDYVLFDLKVLNPELSKKHTGADISVILDNFDTLVKSGVPFTVRLPLIPGVTDTEENIKDIIQILKSHGINYAEALPYNKSAGAKYKLCDREYLPQFDAKREVHIPIKEFSENNIELKVL